MNRLLLVIPAGILVGLGGNLLVPVVGDLGYRGAVFCAGLVAAAGCFRAARCFEAGEHLRKAWLVTAVLYFLIGAAEALPLRTATGAIAVVYLAITIVVNVVGVLGMWLFARAYGAAGLVLPVAPASRRTVYVVAVVVAILIDIVPILDTIHRIQAGQVGAVVNVASSIGDLITLALIGPILLTAVALRGGYLVWPWALLTASTVAWLFMDASYTIQALAPNISEWTINAWTTTWQVLACAMTFAAGEAQRRVSRRT